jgi:hypothetical protein
VAGLKKNERVAGLKVDGAIKIDTIQKVLKAYFNQDTGIDRDRPYSFEWGYS